MFRPPYLGLPPPRHGVILLVVVALLTLFAVVGLSFVLYANAQAAGARLAREAECPTRPDVDPEVLLAYFLGQLVYDAGDDESGVYSALRGHGLARSMYGWNSDTPDGNGVPFNGPGRLHTGLGTAANPWGLDDFFLVNYTYHPADQFLRDPERLPRAGNDPNPLRQTRGAFAGGVNVPYTYPDLNNGFLAAVRADGTVLLPSFHRPWAGFGELDPGNPNWYDRGQPWLKYQVLRPRPADMDPGFPAPEDAGGDVKNLIGGPGGNDSVWLDLGFPVLVAPDGRKFKPLFAPLVLDLDNRVNVNVHGNARGQGQAHASNQGWGPWEVNPRRLAPAGDAARRQEWANLLVGSAQPARAGRYGPDGLPGAGGAAPGPGTPPFYAQVDFDGCDEQAGGAPSGRLLLPGAGAPALSCFPHFNLPPYQPTGAAGALRGYGHGLPGTPDLERAGHPLLANVFRPAGGDRPFVVSDLEALLRYGDTGSPALTSELFRLCPQNFADPRVRRLITTASFDLDHPGVAPWLWEGSPQPYNLNPGALYPSPGPIGSPPPGTPPGGEFGPDGRAASAALGRLDLGRPLPPYPPPGADGRILDLDGFRAAQVARQQLAEDLFVRLAAVTGVADLATSASGTPDHDAARWLAQLAVNVVDYLDPDDCLTPFNWKGPEVVFGTELPRLVLNEAYAEFTRPAPLSENLEVRVWVELHNPFWADATLADGGAARLALRDAAGQPLYGIYQVVVTRTDPADDPATGFRRPDNVLGDPDSGAVHVMDFSDLPPAAPDRVAPADGGAAGFYVVGPGPLPGGQVLPTHLNGRLRYDGGDRPERPTLLLRRLACPCLPPNPPVPGQPVNPALPYNPYVTVDYLEQVALNDADQLPAARASVGREQPYAAARRQRQQPDPPNLDQPQHTFFRPNAPSRQPFDWLVHLDREPVSPAELLHVSGFKPHELTQQFMTGDAPGQRFAHRAPWLDPRARIYRVFEFLATRGRLAGLEAVAVEAVDPVASPGAQAVKYRAAGGDRTPSGVPWAVRPGDVLVVEPGTARHENVRVTAAPADAFEATFLRAHPAGARVALTVLGDRVPGRVNLNTVWDEETFLALCDPQPANAFDDAAAREVFRRLLRRRTPGPDGKPGPADRPLWGMAAGFVPPGDGQYPGGLGLDDTFLAADPEAPPDDPQRRLFQVGAAADHPYLRDQLLAKVHGHLTTRSHVFAVWLTAGFFEVTDDAARPVKLGAELGRAEGRHVRHRMFAVVDRSALVYNPGPQRRFDPRATSPGTAPPGQPAGRRVVPYFSIID